MKYTDPDGRSTTGAVLTWIGTDTAIPDPTDVVIWKWLGYGVIITGAVVIDYFSFKRVKKVFDNILTAEEAKPEEEPSPLPKEGVKSKGQSKGKLEGKSKSNKGQTAEPPGEYPGDDPTKTPDGYEWRGKPGSQPGDKNGSYTNPDTGETLRPDLDHPDGINPHWDYEDSAGNWWRWFPGE